MSYFFVLFLWALCNVCLAKDVIKKDITESPLNSSEIEAYTLAETELHSLSSEACSQYFLITQKNHDLLVEKIDLIKKKIDKLEKQQRDFLALISDIVINPSHSTATQEQNDYQTNLDLMKAQQYSQALKLWKKFVQDYSSSDKVPYAYYWMGELYTVDEKPELAKECYQYLIDEFPSHPKTPEAFLKIAQLEMSLGHQDKAKFLLKTLIQQYPYAQATHLAKKLVLEASHS